MSNVISTGTSVTPRKEAKNIENVFVNASGRNRRPSCAVSENTGMKLTVMTSSAKKSERPTLFAASTITAKRSRLSGSRPCFSRNCSRALCAFSIMIIAESTMAPIAMAMPPSDMMLLVRPSHHIGRNERIMAMGSVMIATSEQRRFDLFDLLFDSIDHVERVLAVPHDDDAADGLTTAVQLGHAAPNVASEMNFRDVLDVNRRAVLDLQGDVLNVLNFFDVTPAADEILRCRDF